jgi:BirA family transcriptional regulator, biotin operon repressor / biotin---[acetyl-CoA-carboxylase] ligase
MTHDLSQERIHGIAGGRAFRWLDATQSTNTIGLAWLAEGCAEGSFAAADVQTAGRGRLGRSWYAPPGSALMFTYLFHPPPELAVRATMLGALAVLQTVQALGITNAGIKYPNDVQAGERKVCGILAEAAWHGRSLGVALGIGLNVRIDFAGTSLADSAASLETLMGRKLDRADLLARLLDRLDFWRARIAEPALFQAWRGGLNMLGAQVRVSTPDGIAEGIARDVQDDGALLIEDAHGRLGRVIAGDLLVIRTNE